MVYVAWTEVGSHGSRVTGRSLSKKAVEAGSDSSHERTSSVGDPENAVAHLYQAVTVGQGNGFCFTHQGPARRSKPRNVAVAQTERAEQV
jgi:hypothetical protein